MVDDVPQAREVRLPVGVRFRIGHTELAVVESEEIDADLREAFSVDTRTLLTSSDGSPAAFFELSEKLDGASDFEAVVRVVAVWAQSHLEAPETSIVPREHRWSLTLEKRILRGPNDLH